MFVGADTDALTKLAQKCLKAAQVADTATAFLTALVVTLKAASWFTGGASLAYATYLETTVIPWLKKISMALKLFAKVLGAHADAQDKVSSGESVDFGALPRYETPALPSGDTRAYPVMDLGGSGASTAAGDLTGGAVPATTGAGALPSDPGTFTTGSVGGSLSGVGSDTGAAPIPAMAGSGSTGSFGLGSGSIGTDTGAGSYGSGSYGSGTDLGSLGASTSGDTGSAGYAAGAGSIGAGAGTGGSSGGSAGGSLGGGSGSSGSSGGSGSFGTGSGSLGGADLGPLPAGAGSSGSGTPTTFGADSVGGAPGAESGRILTPGSTADGSPAAAYGAAGAAGALGLGGAAALAGRGGQAAYSSPQGFDYNRIQGIKGNPNVTPEFLRKVEGIADRLKTKPEYLLAAMSFETGGSFAADKRNPQSSATGLIQFMSKTAKGLGTTTAELARMTPVQQLDYVEKYFAGRAGKLGSIEQVYSTILYGRPISDPDKVLFQPGTEAYRVNKGLDKDHQGGITLREAAAVVRNRIT
ncbi:MAG TPA: hypothetical protein P5181_10330 [Dermatophilaceae bacterium]|nr:hypothetical protein [Dermatophilaceae bacterium]HRW19231.1 hypothetical protein [Dermatophilaceae bacterium]